MAVRPKKKTFEPFDEKLFVNVPEELKKLKQWVCWKIQVDEKGEQRKRPFSPELGAWCSTVDPPHWTTFRHAVEGARKFNCLGIGFVFTREDPYVGIDLDACRDKNTGEFDSWAAELTASFNTYSEISPSGTGVKMICRGKLPGKGNRRGAVEMYEYARYFTITGRIVGNSKTIGECQRQIDDLYQKYIAIAPEENYQQPQSEAVPEAIRAIPDDRLLAIAKNAANGKKFSDLWNGSTAAHGEDDSAADLALCSLLAFYTGRDAARIDRLFRQSGLIRKKWDERHGAQTYGQKTIAKAIQSTNATYNPSSRFDELNDDLNAEIYVELNSEKFAHCSFWDAWLAWSDSHWSYKDGIEDSKAYVATDSVEKYLLSAAQLEPGEERRKKLHKWAISSGDKYKKDAMLNIAAKYMDLPPRVFDRDPMLIACRNGVVDLRAETKEKLRPGRREDYITRCSRARYDPTAKCPLWHKFLEEVTEGDEEMIKYLWRVMGYALTGDIRERAFFILHGGGKNGKTTFLETLMAIAGNYSQKARFASFLKSKVADNGPNADVAHMAGARIIVASEADENSILDTSLIKELTGGDVVRARFLYGKEFEFSPVAKFFFATNAIPNIYETTEAIWDRVHLIPFHYRVPEDKVDKMLNLKLRDELDAIFTEAVGWCGVWQALGNLLPPKKVVSERERVRDEMDLLGEWVAERIEIRSDSDDRATVAEVYNDYRAWTEKTKGKSAKPRSKIAVVRYLASRGIPVIPGTDNVKFFTKIRLRTLLR